VQMWINALSQNGRCPMRITVMRGALAAARKRA
jgi:hypothetical protein